MPKHLIIVESPAKGRTIEKYLGPDYIVRASFGHVRDLPPKELGINIQHNFRPEYQIIPKAKKTIAVLKKSLSEVGDVYLATDFDREGEAIAWHVIQALDLNNNSRHPTINNQPKKLAVGSRKLPVAVKRITFHEITKNAIQQALKEPREINMQLVDAQQARRVLDRLVGYKLSPFLWKKVVSGLSAGRVQSVAVRLIVDREREIERFKPQEYWTILANLTDQKKANELTAELAKIDGKKLDQFAIKSQKQAKEYQKIFTAAKYTVGTISVEQTAKYPFPPFTTSTLQQDANRRLGFSSKKTMRLAQDLYEAGKITYMRTDSTHLSWLAINSTRKYIEQHFSERYVPPKPRVYRAKSVFAQEAHEAIRPTYIKTTQVTGDRWTQDHQKLYELIWSRTLACQMAPAELLTTTVEVIAKVQGGKWQEGTFIARGQVLKFDGFMKVYPLKIDLATLPILKQFQPLRLRTIEPKQHFTKPSDRYSEATLVKALEEHGIGRPSTYAPIISTIQDRGYVYLNNRFFYPRDIGAIVTDLLVEHFPEIIGIDFTAEMEANLDLIAHGEKEWATIIRAFYKPFEHQLHDKEATVEKVSFDKEETGQKCPKCGKAMVVKVGRWGKFLACSGYPKCKTTKNLTQSIGIQCPECKSGEVVERFTRRRKVFWGCSRYPECKYASWVKPTERSEMRDQK